MEKITSIQNAFKTVYGSLEKANKQGNFTLAEAHTIHENIVILQKYLSECLTQYKKEQDELSLKKSENNVINNLETIHEENINTLSTSSDEETENIKGYISGQSS